MGKAVKIVDFEPKNGSDKPSLNEKALEKIVNRHAKAKNKPVMVISVGGVARSGKSFLLNMIVHYLTYMEENGTDEGWEESEEPIEGVNWAQSGTSVTHGILIWDKPFLIKTGDDGSEIAIILIDSQGTGDNRKSDVNLDTLIMYISLQLATVQALNIKSYLTSNDMYSLKLCADFADIDGGQAEKSEGHLFESLAFIIRDEQNTGTIGEDPNAFNEMNKDVENAELRSVGAGIKRSFKNITSFNMPHPGPKVTGASVDDDELCPRDLPRNFVEAAKEVIKKLCGFTPSRCGVSCWPSGAQFLATFQTLKRHLENDELTRISSPADAFQDIILNKAFISTQDEFRKAMEDVYVSDRLADINSHEELKALYEEEVAKSKEHFHKAGRVHKYGSTVIWRKYEEMLQALYDNIFSHLKSQYETRMHLKKVEAENEETRLQVEQQAEEFKQQFSVLQEENQQRKQQLEEEKKAQEEREQQHALEVEQLRKEIEESKNDEEMERLREEIERRNQEAQKQKEETEKAKEERDRQMQELNAKIGKMEDDQKKAVEEQDAQKKRLEKELREELEERRRAEEEAANKTKTNWMDNPMVKFVAGALTKAAAGAVQNWMSPSASSGELTSNESYGAGTSGNSSGQSSGNLKSSKPPQGTPAPTRVIFYPIKPTIKSTPPYNPTPKPDDPLD